ncbi:MAG: chemotaxis protein CheW [Kovacikia sp.]
MSSFSPGSDIQFPSVSTADLVPVSTANLQEQFLLIQLISGTAALLPSQDIAEVVTIPIGQITPIPHMPDWVMGVYNWRGEILWMVDLGHLCGFTPWYRQRSNISGHSAVVLQISNPEFHPSRTKSLTLGLVVHRTDDIEWCDPNLIQVLPSAAAVPELEPFLRGYWWSSNNDMLAVLDGMKIMEAMPKP